MQRGVVCVHKPGFLMPGHIYVQWTLTYPDLKYPATWFIRTG